MHFQLSAELSGWAASSMLVGCMVGGLLLLVPESPRWLLKRNHRAEAQVTLERIGGANWRATWSRRPSQC